MRYPQETIEDVRSGNDIVDVVGSFVSLKNSGGNHFALCPFHNEKSPSFSVNADRQMYYCFGCGAGGNVISFVMQIENYDFIDALKWLAERINYPLPQPNQSAASLQQSQTRDTIRKINKTAARFFYDSLQGDTPEARAAIQYLDKRGVHPKLRVSFGLGFSPDSWDSLMTHLQQQNFFLSDIITAGLAKPRETNKGAYDRFRGRLMFPILDVEGNVVGFGGRIMGAGEPKYLNSPETPVFEKNRHLYGIHAARKARAKEILIVEGYMDVLALHQAGFRQTVGVLGTALTPNHTRLLKRINCTSVVLLMDNDRAGREAVLRGIPVLLEAGLKVKVFQVGDGAKDPDEYLQMHGAARFAEALQRAQSHVNFRIGLLRNEYDLQNTEQRILFTNKSAEVLAGLDNAIECDAYIRETAGFTGIAPEAIKAEVDKRRNMPGAVPRDRPGLRYNLQGDRDKKGLINARKEILSLLFAYPVAGQAMQEGNFLTAEEIGEGLTADLLTIAYENSKKGVAANPADIIARFDKLEEQRQAAEILRDSPSFENAEKMEQALNQMWKVVKRAWLSQKIAEKQSGDIEGVNALLVAKRDLEREYIRVSANK